MSTPDIRIRGVRQTIPAGYLLGRLPGSVPGPVQLVSLQDIAQQLIRDAALPNPVPLLLNEFLGFSGTGLFGANQAYQMPIATRNIVFPSTSAMASQSKAWCSIVPTSNFTVVLVSNLASYQANGTSVLCSVLFLAGQPTGTFTYTAGPITIPARTYTWLVMPAVADPTMAGLYLQFVGDGA